MTQDLMIKVTVEVTDEVALHDIVDVIRFNLGLSHLTTADLDYSAVKITGARLAQYP